jgi:hypothetical protein
VLKDFVLDAGFRDQLLERFTHLTLRVRIGKPPSIESPSCRL